MENTLTLPKLEAITQVYKHRKDKTGGCRCGCLGTYWYPSTAENTNGSSRNDRMVKKVYDIIVAAIPTADPKTTSITGTYIDVWVEDRFYTMYFKGKGSSK